jgi:hypothetical protein
MCVFLYLDMGWKFNAVQLMLTLFWPAVAFVPIWHLTKKFDDFFSKKYWVLLAVYIPIFYGCFRYFYDFFFQSPFIGATYTLIVAPIFLCFFYIVLTFVIYGVIYTRSVLKRKNS